MFIFLYEFFFNLILYSQSNSLFVLKVFYCTGCVYFVIKIILYHKDYKKMVELSNKNTEKVKRLDEAVTNLLKVSQDIGKRNTLIDLHTAIIDNPNLTIQDIENTIIEKIPDIELKIKKDMADIKEAGFGYFKLNKNKI